MSFKSFIILQFNYCPYIHERALRIVYQYKFQTLLKCDKSTSTHMKSLQYLATELSKVKNGLFPELIKEIYVFQKNEAHNLRSSNHLAEERTYEQRNMELKVFQI